MPNNAQNPANRVSETSVSASAAPQLARSAVGPTAGGRIPGLVHSTPSQQKSLREARFAGHAVPANSAYAVSVNPVWLYARRAQVLPHHQLPHAKFSS